MDHVRRDAALRRLERARERAGRARIRAIALSVGLFGILWLAVFSQMATGNDPALSNNTTRKVQPPQGSGGEPKASLRKPQPRPPATVLAYDPVTGMIVRVPASATQSQASAPAPAPAPVITSQS